MKALFVPLFAVLLIPLFAEAKILVISDIDDTLKITHVRDIYDAARSAFQTKRAFIGMRELFLQIDQLDEVDFHYVSAAPELLMQRAHAAFLREHRYPNGSLWLRPAGEDKAHFKNRVISQLVQDSPAALVFLFGDNGELDPGVFAEVQKNHPQSRMISWVHGLYEKDLQRAPYNQRLRPYITAVEIASDLAAAGLFSMPQVLQMEEFTLQGLKQDPAAEGRRPQVWPSWAHCSQAMARFPRAMTPRWAEVVRGKCSVLAQ